MQVKCIEGNKVQITPAFSVTVERPFNCAVKLAISRVISGTNDK